MSTTPVDTWAVDLKDVTFIYPGAESLEGIMALVAIVLWLAWHVWQLKFENKTFEEEKKKYATAENVKQGIQSD